MKPEIKYIGKQITIKTLKDFITDSGLSEDKTILLHSRNFDDIILEYRDFYNESMLIPYFLLGILIEEDESRKVPVNRIGIVQEEHFDIISNKNYEDNFDLYDGENAYRCTHCGSIVDSKGNEMFDDDRDRVIRYIENYENPIVNYTSGKCCKDRW